MFFAVVDPQTACTCGSRGTAKALAMCAQSCTAPIPNGRSSPAPRLHVNGRHLLHHPIPGLALLLGVPS